MWSKILGAVAVACSAVVLALALAFIVREVKDKRADGCHTLPNKSCTCYVTRIEGDASQQGGWAFEANTATCEMTVRRVAQKTAAPATAAPAKP